MDKPDEELLDDLARGKGMDSSLWPRLLEHVLSRLEHIVQHDFPPSQRPAPAGDTGTARRVPSDQGDVNSSLVSSQASQTTNKENAPPTSPPPPRARNSLSSSELDGGSGTGIDHQSTRPEPPSPLTSIRTSLTTSFAKMPPHTIQRLAELILRPRAHYRYVGPYLRAFDRVVSVSSGADAFPLVADRPGAPAVSSLPNGTGSFVATGGSWNAMLDADDSLGGALLTPIPWLQSEGPDDMPSDVSQMGEALNGFGDHERAVGGDEDARPASLRDVGAVTQGELLRQEQQAGIIPVVEPIGRQSRAVTDETAISEAEDHPHPSGPGEVGVEDTGPQDPAEAPGRFDVDVALGRKAPHAEPAHEEDTTSSPTSQAPTEANTKDGDVVITDADGKPDSETSETSESK